MDGMESFSPDARNERAREEELERRGLGFHNEGLHDEEEDRSGAKINEATGLPINKTEKETGTVPLDREIEIDPEDQSTDVMGSLPKEDDAAAKWLREHDKGDDLKKAA